MAGAQSTVGIQGPGIVHEASRAIRLTHWLSCTSPGCPWHVQAPAHVATHHALVHTRSISLGTWCLHIRSYASRGYPPCTEVHLRLPQAMGEQLSFRPIHGASAGRHRRCHAHPQTFPSSLICRHTGQHAEEPGKVPHSIGIASSQLPSEGCEWTKVPSLQLHTPGACGGGGRSTISSTPWPSPGGP